MTRRTFSKLAAAAYFAGVLLRRPGLVGVASLAELFAIAWWADEYLAARRAAAHDDLAAATARLQARTHPMT